MPLLSISADAKLSGRRLLKIALLAVLFCSIYIHAACALTPTFSITQNTQLQFGTLQTPPCCFPTWTVSPSGATSGTGSATLLYGTTSAGSYTITCTSHCTSYSTINLDIQNNVSGNANLIMGPFTGSYGGTAINSFPANNLAKPAPTTLLLGSTALYTPSVFNGSFTPSFDIVLTFQ